MANNLPGELTSFVGRERELAEIKHLLAGTRLLTLTGPGGVGKSRLALRLARDVEANYPDGVWLIELASVRSSELVPPALAGALGVTEKAGTSLRPSLIDHLKPRRVLLLLDNCEHLLDACADLAVELLTACPALTVVTTSREPLNVSAEMAWLVPSLVVPDSVEKVELEQACGCEAMRLFSDRAVAARSDFVMTDANALAVAHICRRLDGIPLAIELAAVRTRVLTPEQIASRLSGRFELLSAGNRRSVPRHVTLRSSVDWSYELLSEQERMLFQRLAVFEGGWSLEAAEAICSGLPLKEPVLSLLSQLVDKSLVVRDNVEDQARYRFLETIREYAAERLRESSDLPALRRRHAEWFAQQAESVRPEAVGPEISVRYRRINADLANVRAALDCCKSEDILLGLELAGSLMLFWYRWGYLTEGRVHLTSLLARSTEAPQDPDQERRWTAARARALLSAGQLAMRQGSGEAHELLDISLALAQRLRDQCAVAAALSYRGRLAYRQGDPGGAKRRLNQALVTAREAGMPWIICHALHGLGLTFEASGDYAQAKEFFEAELTSAQELNDPWFAVVALHTLLFMAIDRGALPEARSLLGEAVTVQRNGGFRVESPNLVQAGACLASIAGQPVRAVRLAGAAAALRERYGDTAESLQSRVAERIMRTSQVLQDEAARQVWVEGRALTTEQALEEAVAVSSASGAQATRGAPRVDDRGLTPREREIASLLVRRLTNHEIAQLLVVSDATVKTHVENILGKLGLRSRREVAALAEQTSVLESASV